MPPAERSSTAGRRLRRHGAGDGLRAHIATLEAWRSSVHCVTSGAKSLGRSGPPTYADAPCHRASCPTSCVPPWPGWLRCCRSTELGERFADAGHELALVGGPGARRVPRPGLAGPRLHHRRPPRRDPGGGPRLGGRALGHRREFGTIGLRKGAYVIEMTTYRADIYDRTSRKPEVMFGTT